MSKVSTQFEDVDLHNRRKLSGEGGGGGMARNIKTYGKKHKIKSLIFHL